MNKRQILQLYRSLMYESRKLPSYNFRQYALRKVRDSFKENKALTDVEAKKHIDDGFRNLEIIKRQVIIGHLYSTDKLVIEHLKAEKK